MIVENRFYRDLDVATTDLVIVSMEMAHPSIYSDVHGHLQYYAPQNRVFVLRFGCLSDTLNIAVTQMRYERALPWRNRCGMIPNTK